MSITTPGMFAATHCPRCGQRQRSPNHVCQPSAKGRFNDYQAWGKRSLAAAQPVKKK